MFEMLIKPRKAERHPWELFFIGLFYASLALLIANWVFAQDTVLSKYLGVLVVTFTVLFSMPYVYYTIRLEEKKVSVTKGTIALLQEHKKALMTFLWLFLGYVVAFSFWYIVLSNSQSFQAQIETYCVINRPTNFEQCVSEYTLGNTSSKTTGLAAGADRLFMIFTNNIYVLIFTLLFSLLFGAGVIFILAWNASVIAAAIGIFAKSELSALPLGLARYALHGIPEIASYFIVALAGGMVSVAVIRHETGTEKFWEVLEDSLHLVIIAVVVLFIAALLEVFVTPIVF
jgi:uncharacterized membrane protein SpoIIM required for sporulation